MLPPEPCPVEFVTDPVSEAAYPRSVILGYGTTGGRGIFAVVVGEVHPSCTSDDCSFHNKSFAIAATAIPSGVEIGLDCEC